MAPSPKTSFANLSKASKVGKDVFSFASISMCPLARTLHVEMSDTIVWPFSLFEDIFLQFQSVVVFFWFCNVFYDYGVIRVYEFRRCYSRSRSMRVSVGQRWRGRFLSGSNSV